MYIHNKDTLLGALIHKNSNDENQQNEIEGAGCRQHSFISINFQILSEKQTVAKFLRNSKRIAKPSVFSGQNITKPSVFFWSEFLYELDEKSFDCSV